MTRIKAKTLITIVAITLIEPIANQRPSIISARRRTTAHKNIQKRNIISPEMIIRDTLLTLKAAIKATLTTTLSNTLLLIKEIKMKIQTLKPIYKRLII